MYFQHSDDIWQAFPELVPGVVVATGIRTDVSVDARIAPYNVRAEERLATASEGELPEIQAWRRAFSRMGLKPTQYRCASESLLRRFRKEGSLPSMHPLIDLCNAVSLAHAIPIAVFDAAHIDSYLEVRHALGNETYQTFSGDIEHPAVGEVIFADAAGQAHARRWTNRQSGFSSIRDTTAAVVIVAEAMHSTAREDVGQLVDTLVQELQSVWSVTPQHSILSRATPRFEFQQPGDIQLQQ